MNRATRRWSAGVVVVVVALVGALASHRAAAPAAPTPADTPQAAATAESASTPAPAGTPQAAAAPVPVATPLTYEVRSGRETYRYYCQTCHGETGAGDGFNAYNLDPRPRDLGDPAFQKKSDADIRDAIRRGGAGVGLSPLMPPWGKTLGDRKIDDVIFYLRTLRRPPS